MKKLISILLVLAILSVLAVVSVNAVVLSASGQYMLSKEEAQNITDVDTILVLGCKVNGDVPSDMLRDRLICGIELYGIGVSSKLLMSGDHGQKDYDEVGVMKQYATSSSVPSEDIFMDHAGFSTYESMYRAKEIFGVKKIIIVTQEYHLYRAIYIARSLGIEAYGVASDLNEYAGQEGREVREVFARCKDILYCIIKPDPTYLGDKIDIAGNGDVTN